MKNRSTIPNKKTPPHARGENTMSDLMKKIRAFCNWLELTGYIDRTPFKDYNMPGGNYGTPVCLTIRFKNPLAPYLNGREIEGVSDLDASLKQVNSIIKATPGIKTNHIGDKIGRSTATVERYLSALKKKDLIRIPILHRDRDGTSSRGRLRNCN